MIRGRLHMIVLMCVLATIPIGTTLAQSVEPDTKLLSQSEGFASSSSPETPRIPVLPPEIEVEAKNVEREIDSILHHGQRKSDQDIQRLIEGAKLVVRVRTQYQGEKWWQSIDARRRLQDLDKWASLSVEDRAAWAQFVSLTRQAQKLDSIGRYQEAIPLAGHVLVIREKVWGPDHPYTAIGLHNLAILYKKQGQYAQARPLYERALAIYEKTLGMEHPKTAALLNNFASLYERQGQYAQAQPLYEQALKIQEKVLGPDHPNTAMSLNDLAVLYRYQLQYMQAVPLAERALAIREKALGADHVDTATSLHGLAALYKEQGQYAQARSLYERALAIYEKTLGIEHPDTAALMNNLAELCRAQGQYAQALPLYQRALMINEKALGLEHPYTAALLNNLASLHQVQGQYVQAQPLAEQALAIREKLLGAEHPDTTASLNNLAMLYQVQGQYAQAQPLYERALAINEKVRGLEHVQTATNLHNLAVLYEAQGAYAQARPLYERALVIYEKVQGDQHPSMAVILSGLAELDRVQGQYAQAKPQSERALAIYEKALGPEHPHTAIGFERLAAVKLQSQPDEETAKLLLQASQAKWKYLTRTFPSLSTVAQQQFLTKSTLQLTPQWFWPLFTALPTLDRAVGFQATLLSKQLVTEAMRHESSVLRQVLADAPPAWRTLWQQREDLRRQYATRAFQDDPARPRPTIRQSTKEPTSTRDLSDQIDQLEQQLRRENPAYAAQAQLEQISVDQVQGSLRPQDLLLEYVQFNPYDPQAKYFTDNLHYGVYVVRGDQTPIVAIDLGEAAPIDTAVQQIHQTMRILIEQSKQMAPSRKQLRQSEAELAEISSTLRKLIWTPLETQLNGIKRVYVASDGQLSLIPFEMLAKKTKQGHLRYLVEEREVVYVNTGRDLARLALTANPKVEDPAEPPAKPTAVLVGNPAFDATPQEVAQVVAGLPTPLLVAQSDVALPGSTLGVASDGEEACRQVPRDWGQFPQLDHLLTKAETQFIRAGWRVTALKSTAAVEEAVLRVQAPRILQLATHGYLLDPVDTSTGSWDNPLLRSMLLLTGVNRADPQQRVFYRVGADVLAEADARKRGLSEKDLQQARIDIGDGILTAYEVTGMNLQGTELVNLTACETGLGKVTPEGVIGLRQAFLLAGARALTMSLWEVPVDETTHQIEAFYTRWLGEGKNHKGKHRKKAATRYATFHETQLEALAQAREQYGVGHPYFWAGTIYLGDPGDLPTPAPSHNK